MKTKRPMLPLLGAAIMMLQILLPAGYAAAAAAASLQAYGTDTVAGYPALLKSSPVAPNASVTFQVTKADGSTINVPARSDASGVAKANLSDYHTRMAGRYLLSASVNGFSSGQSSFKVVTDKVDGANSSVTASSSLAQADGKDTLEVKVRLADRLGNPVSGHVVQLISSRADDKVTSNVYNDSTDQEGVITFNVSSSASGASTFTAVDTTSNTVLANRAQGAFVGSGSYLADAGGNFGFLNIAKAATGTLHHFEITDVPSNVQPGQNVGFRITAQDDGNQTVQNYSGKVHFSAEGSNSSNVTLPEDYTFKAEDLGTHNFSLGLSFALAGTYKIVVNDLDNPLIKGEKVVTVGSNNGDNNQPPGNGSKPTIESPIPGTYSQKAQTVTGKAPAGSNIKIFDNEQEIGTAQTGSDGKFSFQTPNLNDGLHKMYVVTLDSNQSVQNTSETVQFTIDTTAPKVDEITLKPQSGIKSGDVVTIDVLSEENLSQAAAVFNADITELNPSLDKPGHYIGSVKAPATSGVYPIDIILVDQLGNEASYKAKAQVNVSAEGGTATTDQTPDTQTPSDQPTEPTNPPSKVTGLISYAKDKTVTLVWEAATATANAQIKHYRVYYGNDPSNLSSYVNTKDAATTWYVPNLENGKEYYFALTAFDDKGVESKDKSEVVSGIPFVTETSTLPKPTDELNKDAQANLHGVSLEDNPPDKVNEGGPEVLWLLSGAGFVSSLVLRKKKIKN
jgi:hypothetical protein